MFVLIHTDLQLKQRFKFIWTMLQNSLVINIKRTNVIMIKFNQKIKTDSKPNVNYYVTSDLHFHHKSVLNFCPTTRPWSTVEEMNEGLISHWNEVVGEEDVVLHLGDFSFKGKEATEEILSQLNGNIVFLYGNHDKVLRSSIKGLTAYDYLEFRFNGVKVCCSHYPMASWNQQGRGSVMLHGHTHGSYKSDGRVLDIGFDNMGKIIPLQEAIDICLAKDIYCADHHKVVV